MKEELRSRLDKRVTLYQETYQTANELLDVAFREAAPWVSAYVMMKRIPTQEQLEQLAAQLVAIVDAGST